MSRVHSSSHCPWSFSLIGGVHDYWLKKRILEGTVPAPLQEEGGILQTSPLAEVPFVCVI
jgi:hypothetical protein